MTWTRYQALWVGGRIVATTEGSWELYGKNLFGDTAEPERGGKLSDDFVLPPFSVLNGRDGYWQERKRAWTATGIKSELGRDVAVYESIKATYMAGRGTSSISIFDPVLCELAYRWFCPPGGQVVDPFAGGSVRGIVAGLLGYPYYGIDLRLEQIEANREQGRAIMGQTVTVKISAASLAQMFHPCEADYVKSTCHGRCCDSKDGIKVFVHESEKHKFDSPDHPVVDGYMVADARGRCPFKTDDDRCGVHADKPLGCRFSPFTLNAGRTVIIRNRYRLLPCFSSCAAPLFAPAPGPGYVPAYVAHRWSLGQLFGEAEASRIAKRMENDDGDIEAQMPLANYRVMNASNSSKGSATPADTHPVWACGDSMDLLEAAPEADFIFTCPPYGDLEQYSDDPRDLSNMGYPTFVAAYTQLIKRCAMKLKNNRMACFVVGDFRDKKTGMYRGFVADTINAFREAGMHLYNDAILVTSVGSLPVRVSFAFDKNRKLGKTHQNVLVFAKGDPTYMFKNGTTTKDTEEDVCTSAGND